MYDIPLTPRESALARSTKAIIRYDGPALANHEMDVHDLAPALLAVGDLCKIANEVLNGSSASVKVLVRADIEQQCFQLQFELVQTLYDQLTSLIDSETVKDAKELLEWLGIAGGTAAGGYGLFKLYKWIWSKEGSQVGVQASGSDGSVIYQIIGDGNLILQVPAAVHKIASDPRTLPAVKRILAPLERPDYQTLEFQADGRVTTYFTSEEAKRIISAPEDAIIVRSENELTSTIKTAVGVRKAVFEGSAKWTIVYKRAVEAKMADADWLRDYQNGVVVLLPRSRLIVDLEEKVPLDQKGEQAGEAAYTIVKVHGIETPPHQPRLAGT